MRKLSRIRFCDLNQGKLTSQSTYKHQLKVAPIIPKFNRGKLALTSAKGTTHFGAPLRLAQRGRSVMGRQPIKLAPLRSGNSNKVLPADRFLPFPGVETVEDKCLAMQFSHNGNDDEAAELHTDVVYKNIISELLNEKQRYAAYVEEKLFSLRNGDDEISKKLSLNMQIPKGKANIRTERSVPHYAEKIFDAPNIREDFYLNVVDWSYNHVLAVGLDQDLFVCTLRSGDIIGGVLKLTEYEENDYISALRFSSKVDLLAVALNSEELELWNIAQQRCVRTLSSTNNRIGSMSWNGDILTTGDRGGQICHHDVRLKSSIVAKYSAHEDEVCGLQWSPNGRYLASGGNDNHVQIYSDISTAAKPLLNLTEHQAAVKAIAWSPVQSNILATGGGSDDRKIRIWNVSKGICLKTKDTGAQVSGLLWSGYFNELATCNGLPSNRVVIWTYPYLNVLKRLKEHSNRILSMVMSPCGEYILTAGADESIRVWHVFDKSGKYHFNCRSSSTAEEESLSDLMSLVKLK
uniref:WD_REPEATS_REGION domain-containing protein n=1 Tax=Trichuris muris TaxID=70415 RepID=A0A5S6QE05_TRIMR